MNSSNRRVFIMQVVASSTALAATQVKAQAKLTESDPQASALGYKEDTTKVDAAKYPKHTAEQHCGNCQLFAGKATDPAAGCAIFGGKLVANKGWCSAWVKKA